MQVHFRSGIGGDTKVTESAEELLKELEDLLLVVKEQVANLESCIGQVDQYQIELQQLRQQIAQVEHQLRVVMAPTYSPHDREKAIEEQQVGTKVFASSFVCKFTRVVFPINLPFEIERQNI